MWRVVMLGLFGACSSTPVDQEPAARGHGDTTQGGERESVPGAECVWERYQPPPGCAFVPAGQREFTDLASIDRHLHVHVHLPGTICEETRDMNGKRLVVFDVIGNGLHNLSDLEPLSVECGDTPTVTIRQDVSCGGVEPSRASLVIVMPAGPPVELANVGQRTCNYGGGPTPP